MAAAAGRGIVSLKEKQTTALKMFVELHFSVALCYTTPPLFDFSDWLQAYPIVSRGILFGNHR